MQDQVQNMDESENNISTDISQFKEIDNTKTRHKLSENEILKFKNLQLQKQLHRAELNNISLQEELIARSVSVRVGEDISGWQFDIQNGVVFKPQSSK